MHAGTHGGTDRNLFQISSFGARRLGFDDGVDQSLGVFVNRFFAEADFAHAGMNDTGLLGTILNFAGFAAAARIGGLIGAKVCGRSRKAAVCG